MSEGGASPTPEPSIPEPSIPEPSIPEPSIPGARAPLEILVAEDSATQAEELRYLLTRAGHRVVVAKSGEEALERLEAQEFDLLLSDIVMPGISGYELCLRVRSDPRREGVAVILVTGLSDSRDVFQALESGADGFVGKPYEEQQLLATIESTLANVRENPRTGGLDYVRGDERVRLRAGPAQIVNLVLLSYQAAIRQQQAVELARDDLALLNATLEERVHERTRALEQEVVERRGAEEALALSQRFLELANRRHFEREELLRAWATEVRALSGCEAAALRLLDEQGICSYRARDGAPGGFHLRAQDLNLKRAACLCVEALAGRRAAEAPCWTERGSFHVSRVSELSDAQREAVSACDEVGYESVLMIPVRLGSRVLGLIEAVDREAGKFPAALVAELEKTGLLLGGALGRLDAEQRLRVAAQEWRATFDAIGDAVFLVDSDSRIQRLNLAAARFAQRPARELIGRTCCEVLLQVTAEEAAGCPLSALLATPGRETQLLAIGERWCEATAYPLQQGEGVSAGTVLSLADVTEQVRAKALLKEKEEQLLQSQKMEAIGRLAGGVAHDFNNLLCVIDGYAALLSEKLDDGDELWKFADRIVRAAEQASGLTNQLLAFSRKQVTQPRIVNLDEVVQKTQELLARLIGEDVRVELDLAAPGSTVHIDPAQLGQILTNLSVNARDAMPQGGTLRIATQRIELDAEDAELEGCAPGPFVALSVTDTGVGMSQQTLQRIFEPFFTTKAPGEGTGLGLSTVFGIVEQNRGYVRARSELGQGSRFTVALPEVEAVSDKDQAPEQPRPALPREHTKVLVTEDFEELREFAVHVLELQGYEVLSATCGEDALELLREQQVDLLLTDLVMPGMSGRELADEARLLQPDLAVLVMSGYTDDAVIRHGVEAAKVPFLQKPFRQRELLGAVAQALGPRP